MGGQVKPKDWTRAELHFHRLVELDPAGRAEALEEISREDPALGEELEALLAARARGEPADPAPSSRRFLAELKRRNVFRVAALYGVIGFGVIEIAEAVFPHVALPGWAVTLVVWLVLLGFPVALVLAWAFEATPGGVRRTRSLRPAILDALAAQPAKRRWPAGLAGLLGGALLVGGAWFAMSGDEGGNIPIASTGGADRPVTIAVVAASDAESDSIGEGLAGLLARGLDDVPGLRSAPENLVMAGWRGRDEQVADSAAALAVARTVDASAAIVLSVNSIGTPLRIRARVYPVPPAPIEHGSIQVQGEPAELIELVDELAVRLVAKLVPGETSSSASIAAISTGSLPAMRAFLLGEEAMRRGAIREAIPHFERAVEADSTFALAWHRLQNAHGWSGELTESEAAGMVAARHADQLPERERLIVLASAGFSSAGGRLGEVENAVRLNPDDWQLLELLSEMYLHDAWRAGISPRAADSVRALAAEAAPDKVELLYHGIDLALGFHHDPALADARLAHLDSIAPAEADQDVDLYRLQRRLVFGGGDVERQDSLLRAVPDERFSGFPYPLAHPRSTTARLRVNRAISGRDVMWSKLEPEFFTHVTRGDIRSALEAAATADTTPLARFTSPRSRTCHAYLLLAAGVDLSGTGAWASEPPGGKEPSSEEMLCMGGLAVDEERWVDAESWIGRIRASAAADGDSPESRQDLAAATALERYLGWTRGTSDGLIPRSVRLDVGAGESWPIRWWTGRMLAGEGRTREAIDVYESFWFPAWVPAFIERAELSARLGRPGRARELYETVLAVWADADPAFRPLVERARTGLAELPEVPGETGAARP